MENQHRAIKGYRELGQEEINLMNAIKEKGRELIELQNKLFVRLELDARLKASNKKLHEGGQTDDYEIEYNRFVAAQPFRWAEIGKTNIELGIMALVRAVAQPS
jgi:hypothetical protein